MAVSRKELRAQVRHESWADAREDTGTIVGLLVATVVMTVLAVVIPEEAGVCNIWIKGGSIAAGVVGPAALFWAWRFQTRWKRKAYELNDRVNALTVPTAAEIALREIRLPFSNSDKDPDGYEAFAKCAHMLEQPTSEAHWLTEATSALSGDFHASHAIEAGLSASEAKRALVAGFYQRVQDGLARVFRLLIGHNLLDRSDPQRVGGQQFWLSPNGYREHGQAVRKIQSMKTSKDLWEHNVKFHTHEK